uniref:Uncharacterized protein n=1 Tax=Romanomermis culicivorax TaxID=13658 RepID=A0A915IT24_ROMCU
MKCGLRRWARKGQIPVEDAYNLPIKYQVTERGRFAEEVSPYALRFIHMDYEIATYNEVSQVFPEVMVKGCNFHFPQALNRKLQLGNYLSRYIPVFVPHWGILQ